MGTAQQGQQGSAPVLSAGFPNKCQLRLLQAPHDLAFLVIPPGRPAAPQVSRLYRTTAHSAALDGHSHFLPQPPHLQSGLGKANVMGCWR